MTKTKKGIPGGRVWIVCLLTALVLLAVGSECSFLYPFNDWVDANIFFTMGKSMMNGKVLYRDIYDHKGPLLYFIHGLAYLISAKSFVGVYFVEIISWTAFLAGVHQIVTLYVKKEGIWYIPLVGALLISSPSFCHGDSAEELVLPFLIWGLYYLLYYLKNEYPALVPLRDVFIFGIFAGIILCIKFTLLGLYLAWTLILIFLYFSQGKWKHAVATGLCMLAGMFAASLPFLIYFAVNGALGDLWTGYIYNNLFLYSGAGNSSVFRIIKDIAKMTLDTFVENWRYGIFTIIGVLWYGVFDKREQRAAKIALWVLCVITTVGICIGVKQWQPYYGLILSVFSPLGIAVVLEGIPALQSKKRIDEYIRLGFCAVISALLVYWGGNYTDSLFSEKESLVQYQFAEQMKIDEDTTLLNYGFLDGGFYTVTGIVPDCKYFAKLNLNLPEMYETQERYIAEGRADYVVTREFELDEEYQDLYRLVDSGEQVYEGILYPYYLYEKIRD